MLNPNNTPVKQTSITITPVSNGFVVVLPRPFKPMSEMMPDFGEVMATAMGQIEGDDIAQVIRESKKINDQNSSKYELSPDQYTFIFDSLEKVLAFLSHTFLEGSKTKKS